MIYLKNNNEQQTIFIPRNELQKEAYVTSTKTYEDGYREGLEDGKEYQKDQLLNLYVTENGQYEREDGWGVVTVDVPIEECPDCPEGGTCNLGEGEIYLTASDAGFYELYAADDGYDGWSKFYVTLENGGAIKIHKASDLLDFFNNGGQIDFGAYCYVGGKITEIQEINVEFGNATYVLDNGFKVYRGDWIDGSLFGEDQIKVGAYIVVYGIIQDYRGELQFKAHSQVIAYQECEGGEIVSCNIQEYKWVRPSMADRAENGDIYIYPDDGYDAVGYIDLDPSDIYNEAFAQGKAEGKAEGGDLNIGAVSTSIEAGNDTRWTRTAAQYDLDGITEITIDGTEYQEWTKAYTLLQAYQRVEVPYITENGEYRANIGYDGFALNGYNVGWVTDVIPTIDTDVEIWVKPYDGAPNMWQGFIGSQVSDDDNTTFQIRKVDGNNTFSFRFGEQIYECGFEYERWYRLRMNRYGVWVNGEQVCGWDVQAFEENPNPLMINGIYNLNFEEENYRMNYASYGYVYFHNTDSLLIPFNNDLFIGNKNQAIEKLTTEDAVLQYEIDYYSKGYTKVIVDIQNGEGGNCDDAYNSGYNQGYEDGYNANTCKLRHVDIYSNGWYDASYFTQEEDVLESINGFGEELGWFDLGQKIEYGDSVEVIFSLSPNESEIPTLIGCESGDWGHSTFAVRQYGGYLSVKVGDETSDIQVTNDGSSIYHKLLIKTREGIWFDDEHISGFDAYSDRWTPTDATLCVGAMNSLTDGFWRPWNGCVGNVTIYKSDGSEHHYTVGDYGKWGEYRYEEGDTVLPNLKGDGSANLVRRNSVNSFNGFSSVEVKLPTLEAQLKEYYYNPITVSDSGFGERAKTFKVKRENMYDGGWFYEDSFIYLPTSNNMNDVRTRRKPREINSFPFEDNAAQYTAALYMDLERINMNDTSLPNLYKLELGSDCNYLQMNNSNLPNINTLVIEYNGQQFFEYHFNGTQFKNGGTLYVNEGLKNAENIREALGSEWIIKYL